LRPSIGANHICWDRGGTRLGTRHASAARGVLERDAVAVGGGPRPWVRTRPSKRQRVFGRKM